MQYLSSPLVIRTAVQEIDVLSRLLQLSPCNLLDLAREVAENGALRSVADLTEAQRVQLVQLLERLAAPAREERRAVA